VHQSLVQVDEPAEGAPRFVMLETIRDYARERLGLRGEEDALRRVHAESYLSLAEEAEPAVKGPEPAGRATGSCAPCGARRGAALGLMRE
jgi:predicted ATPase